MPIRFFFLLMVAWALPCCAGSTAPHAGDQILLSAKINTKSLRFIFDTGCQCPVLLFPGTAEKIGVKVVPEERQLKESDVLTTEPCDLDFNAIHTRVSVAVLKAPDQITWDADGIIGWPAVSQTIFRMDAVRCQLDFLAQVPEESLHWTKFPIQAHSDFIMEIPDPSGTTLIAVDTGKDRGMVLPPKQWQEWKAAHAHLPVTLNASYMPAIGLVVKEESFASEMSLGRVKLTQVPIMETNRNEYAAAPRFVATLGLAALARMDMIVDGKHGIAYIRPNNAPPLPYEHNRAGAVFVPPDFQSDDAIAHVVEGGPAFEAGIRNDDVLLKIGAMDVTKWRTDPNVLPLTRFFSSPAGTELQLTLRRGDKVFKTTVVLRNILPPDSTRN